MTRILILIAACAAIFAAASPAKAQTLASAAEEEGPRFLSLKHDVANGRRGPSTMQPVLWRYTQRGLPVQVLGRSGAFRWVRDPAGDRVWIHESQLSVRKTVFARGPNGAPVVVLERPRARLKPVAMLETGAVAELLACEGAWRKLKVKNRTGWAQADQLWAADQCGAPAGS